MTIFKIYKYPLIPQKDQSIEIEGAIKVLSIAKKGDSPIMYVLVDPEKKQYTKKSVFEIKMIGTGHEIENDENANDFMSYEFMSTLSFQNDTVFHYFVRRRFLE